MPSREKGQGPGTGRSGGQTGKKYFRRSFCPIAISCHSLSSDLCELGLLLPKLLSCVFSEYLAFRCRLFFLALHLRGIALARLILFLPPCSSFLCSLSFFTFCLFPISFLLFSCPFSLMPLCVPMLFPFLSPERCWPSLFFVMNCCCCY